MIELKETIKLEDLPLEDDPKAIMIFARTFNGYEYFGSFDECAQAAKEQKRCTIIDLRNELFFAWRAGAHKGDTQTVVSCYNKLLPYFRELLA